MRPVESVSSRSLWTMHVSGVRRHDELFGPGLAFIGGTAVVVVPVVGRRGEGRRRCRKAGCRRWQVGESWDGRSTAVPAGLGDQRERLAPGLALVGRLDAHDRAVLGEGHQQRAVLEHDEVAHHAARPKDAPRHLHDQRLLEQCSGLPEAQNTPRTTHARIVTLCGFMECSLFCEPRFPICRRNGCSRMPLITWYHGTPLPNAIKRFCLSCCLSLEVPFWVKLQDSSRGSPGCAARSLDYRGAATIGTAGVLLCVARGVAAASG